MVKTRALDLRLFQALVSHYYSGKPKGKKNLQYFIALRLQYLPFN